jgi:hypothetical protein
MKYSIGTLATALVALLHSYCCRPSDVEGAVRPEMEVEAAVGATTRPLR